MGRSERDGFLAPPPPPPGWEVLLDRGTGKVFYASVRGGQV